VGMRSFYAAGTPRPLRLAATVEAVQAVGLCVAAISGAIDAASGRSYQVSSGIALVVLEFIVVAGFSLIAYGLAQSRPWSRTPAVMTQVLVAVVGIFLVQAGHFDWGIPALALAVAGVAGVFAPASLRALNRPEEDDATPPRKETASRRR